MFGKYKKTAALSICLIVAISLAACAPSGGGNNLMDTNTNTGTNTSADAVSIVNVTAKDLIAPSYETQTQPIKDAAAGANDFAFKLGAGLVKEAGDENFVFSPFSVWLPLAALVNATDDNNKPALLEALGAAGVSADDINNAASRMLYDLTNEQSKAYTTDGGYYDPLKIANAIFVGNNVTLKKDFAQTFADYFRGTSFNVDFSSQGAVDAVNKWASDNTDGLITDVVQEFDPETIAAIANAIYFSDRWRWEFDPDQTKEDVFHAPAGDSTANFMIREGDAQTYYEDDNLQAMPLGFTTGGGLYILLPKSGSASDLLASMTSDYFNQIQNDSVQATGKLLLPRFKIDNDIKGLKDALKSIGVPLFDAETAPLTGGLVEENIDVWASDAMQKAMIEVDEKGTTAAAVTVMAMAGSSMPMPTAPFSMVCDKPFAFILYDYTYDGGSQILFTGVVNQP